MLPLVKPKQEERRRHQRVKVALMGRYMLSDRQEYPCQTIDMSPGGVALQAPVLGHPGERVIVYLDQVGRLEGLFVRPIGDTGFAMTITASLRKRDKLAAQLTWLANRKALGLPEDRRHERMVPKNTRGRLILSDGREFICQLLDVSVSGAAIKSEVQPAIGTLVHLGRTQARVVRIFEGGIALEFLQPHHEDPIDSNFD